jgi:hypothetical protein
MTSVAMVRSSFGPSHGLRCEDNPTKHIGVIPTPWKMMPVLGFVEILQVHEYLVLLLTVVFCDFFEYAEY